MKKNLPKIEAAQDWEKAKNFIPKKGQIIIYDGIKENDQYVQAPKIKIGDGITPVTDLPFESNNSVDYLISEGKGILIIN
jgi:hypothetical protein